MNLNGKRWPIATFAQKGNYTDFKAQNGRFEGKNGV